eukprot:m.61174 g.61174  ORF g.61174 m.61174 type:complete len:434 (-) comp13324_c0_seq6:294-1595(-)
MLLIAFQHPYEHKDEDAEDEDVEDEDAEDEDVEDGKEREVKRAKRREADTGGRSREAARKRQQEDGDEDQDGSLSFHLRRRRQQQYKSFSGVLQTSGGQYWMTLRVFVDHIEFHPEWRLQRLLEPSKVQVEMLLKSSQNPHQFCIQLEALVERIITAQSLQEGLPNSAVQRLLRDLSAIGPEHILHVSPSFQEIQLGLSDSNGRQHTCSIVLSGAYPVRAPRCQTTLPISFAPEWSEQAGLVGLYTQFENAIADLQEFWNDVQELYDNTRVLDPATFDFSATIFRIAIAADANASIQITMDPYRPRASPRFQFLGPDHAVAPLVSALSNHSWDGTQSLTFNLQAVLGPFRAAGESDHITTEDVSAVECGVCYTYKLDSVFPDEVCPNKRCSRAFHAACLEEWLRALPETRQSFNTLFGACPYCESQITLNLKR